MKIVLHIAATVLLGIVLVVFDAHSIIPPIVAIGLALITGQVVVSLFTGVLLGSMLHHGWIGGFLRVFDTYFVQALSSRTHTSIVLFSLALAGMAGVMSRSGGSRGIVLLLSRYAREARGGQLAAWLLGLIVFFDDYASTLVVGNTMRPLAEKLRISREKLAYIVDTTATPVASLMVVSTWVGYQASLIQGGLDACGATEMTGYGALLASIPYRFYCIVSLITVALIATMGRDFGPMLQAERRYRSSSAGDAEKPQCSVSTSDRAIEPPEGTPCRWYNGLLPLLLLVIMTAAGLFTTGRDALAQEEAETITVNLRQTRLTEAAHLAGGRTSDELRRSVERSVAADRPVIEAQAHARVATRSLRDVVAHADSTRVLLWASFSASLLAVFLAWIQGLGGGLGCLVDAWMAGVRSMVSAIVILVLAWSLGSVCQHLGTSEFIVSLAHPIVSPWLLPGVIFLLAAVMSFATGTSWGTMSIVIPLAIPLAHRLSIASPLAPDVVYAIMAGTIGAALSGACFGDHCSPISDTTIMSSMTTGCDHVEHVRTQLPYGLTVASVTIILCYLPAGTGFSPLVSMGLAVGAICLILRYLGASPEEHTNGEPAS